MDNDKPFYFSISDPEKYKEQPSEMYYVEPSWYVKLLYKLICDSFNNSEQDDITYITPIILSVFLLESFVNNFFLIVAMNSEDKNFKNDILDIRNSKKSSLLNKIKKLPVIAFGIKINLGRPHYQKLKEAINLRNSVAHSKSDWDGVYLPNLNTSIMGLTDAREFKKINRDMAINIFNSVEKIIFEISGRKENDLYIKRKWLSPLTS